MSMPQTSLGSSGAKMCRVAFETQNGKQWYITAENWGTHRRVDGAILRLIGFWGLRHHVQERMQDRVMDAPLMAFRALTGAGPRGAKHALPPCRGTRSRPWRRYD